MWALFAARPLTVQELAVAISVSGQDNWNDSTDGGKRDPFVELSEGISTDIAGDLVSTLGPLWDVDDESNLVHMQSLLRDRCRLLLVEERGNLPGYYHGQMATSCIEYITLLLSDSSADEKRDNHSPPEDSTLEDDSNLDYDVMRDRVNDLKTYAFQYWPRHYRMATPDDKLDKRIVTFLRDRPTRDNWHKEFETLVTISPSAEEKVSHRLELTETGADLQLASKFGLQGVVRSLISPTNSAEVDAESGYSCADVDCAIDWAARGGYAEVIEILCDRYPKMHGNLALYYAARRGEADIINILLDQGADISRRYDGKRTILMEACSSGSFPAVKALIDKGVDIGAQTEKGRTALEIAAGTGTREIVKLLLSHGAKISENDAGQTALSLSAWVGHTETIKEMIESWKALPTTVDKNSWTLLHVAASSGHVDVVNYLLGKGLSITARNTEGLTPLLCAAESGKLATVKLLLAHDKKSCRDLSAIATNAATAGLPNADVSTERTGPLSALDMPDNYGFTPLMAAAGKGWTDIVRALLSAGADINKRNKSSWTAFQLAAEAGFLSVVKLLLSVATSGGCEGRGLHQEPGLCNAAAGGRAQVAKYLLQRAHESVDAAPASHKKKTALFWAAAEGQTEMVSFLLSRGAAVKPPVSTEVSALHAAVVRGHLDTVKVLVANKADVTALAVRPPEQAGPDEGAPAAATAGESNRKPYSSARREVSAAEISLQSGGLESGEARNNAKLSPIHLATEHPKVLAFLLGLGNPDRTTQVNLCDDSKILPMHVAASYGQVESIKVLHSHGGYIDAPDAKGRTPLLVAAGCGKAEAVDCFLKLGASINAEDDGGWCALHHAAGSGSVETLNRLLDKYPESTDKSRTTRIPPGRTALHIAAKSTKEGVSDVLQRLIEWGCDLEARDGTSQESTPLCLAVTFGTADNVKTLIRAGADPAGETSRGLAPFHLSVDNPEMLKLLIEQGIDVNKTSATRSTALHYACACKNPLEPVKILLEHHLRPDDKDKDDTTPIHICCTNDAPGAKDALEKLLLAAAPATSNEDGDAGTKRIGDVYQQKTIDGNTPLHLAAESGLVDLMGVLIANIKSIDKDNNEASLLRWATEATNKAGWTPLQRAAIAGQVDAVRCLIVEASADPNFRAHDSPRRMTPLTAAICSSPDGSDDVVAYLMSRNDIAVNGLPGDQYRPLGGAIFFGKTALIETLLCRPDIDVNTKEEGSLMTPLLVAARHGTPDILKLLLEQGADLAAHSADNASVLLHAIYNYRPEVAIQVIRVLFDSNAAKMVELSRETVIRGRTPLQLCLERRRSRGMADIALLLVEKGAWIGYDEANAGVWPPIISAALLREDVLVAILDRYGDSIRQTMEQQPLDKRRIRGIQGLRVAVEAGSLNLWNYLSSEYLPMAIAERDQDGWTLEDEAQQCKSENAGTLLEQIKLATPSKKTTAIPITAGTASSQYKAPYAMTSVSAWDYPEDPSVLCISADGLRIEYNNADRHEPVTVRANHPFLPCGSGTSYFEVLIEEASPALETASDEEERRQRENELCVAVGLCGEFADLSYALPGWNRYSFAYHGDNAAFYQEDGGTEREKLGSCFGAVGDVVGCWFGWEEAVMEFYVNGKLAGRLQSPRFRRKLYPVVGFQSGHIKVSVDFGATRPGGASQPTA